MIHWTIAALAFGAGAAVTGAISARHQKRLRQAVDACKREDADRLRWMEDKLEAAEERAMSSKQLTGSQEGWIVVRGMVDEQGQFVGWEILPAYASRRYNTHEEAMQVLDETIRANHLQRADCGTCWHLRNHGQTCDFF